MPPRRISEVPLPTESVIDAVRHSCAGLPVGSTRLAECFYANLFRMAPEVRGMFPEDVRPQHRRMSDALVDVVRYLDSPEDVAQYLYELGAQHHRELGVKPEHYPFVGRALVRAVSEVAPTWSSAMSSAWVLVYEWITANMLAGAEEAARASSGAPSAPVAAHSPAPSRTPSDPAPPHTYEAPPTSGPRHAYGGAGPRPYGASPPVR